MVGIKSKEDATPEPDEMGLKTGDMLALQSKFDEALAAYERFLSIWRGKLERGSSLLAIGKVDRALARIGALASKFLLTGDFERARHCAQIGLTAHPNSAVLNLDRAHALMFLGTVEEARTVYLRYWSKKISVRSKSCGAFIMESFDAFRRAGLLPPLLDEIQRWFLDAKKAEQRCVETNEPTSASEEPTVAEEPAPAAVPADVELGDQGLAEKKLEEALASYRRGLAAYDAELAADAGDLQAQEASDTAVGRIGNVAMHFLVSRKPKRACKIVEEALSYRPSWLRLALIHAHALMLSSAITPAMQLHRKYALRTLEDGRTWAEVTRSDFAALRSAGYRLPIMVEIERQCARQPWIHA